MIQDIGNLHNCSHYFDSQGTIHDIRINSSFEFNPRSIEFLLKDGRKVSLFLDNNPWRATSEGKHASMVYQYCVFCKEKRFENESFSGTEGDFRAVENTIRPGSGETLFTCRKLSCLAEKWFDFADNIAEDKFRSIFTLNKISQLAETISKET